MKYSSKLITVVIVLVIALLTVPSKKRHLSKLRSYTSEFLMENSYEGLTSGSEMFAAAVVANSMIESAETWDLLMKEFSLSLEVKNYGVLSVGYIKFGGTGKRKIGSVALFGTVIPLVKYVKLNK